MNWTSFTRIPLKAQLYERETYFREGLKDVCDVLGPSAPDALWHAALLMVKADGLATGKTEAIVGFLHAHCLDIVGVATTKLSRFTWRELWRYQLTCATLDRLAINDLVLRSKALVLILRSIATLDVPATVYLSGLKGPSSVAAQPPDCLRRLLSQPNRIFSFFHVADEPADFVRELAILFEQPERRRLLSEFAAGRLSEYDRRLLDSTLAASTAESRRLDSTDAIARAEQALHGVVGDGAAGAAHALQTLRRMRRNERIEWQPFVEALAAAGVTLEPWDLATLGASFIGYDEPGTSKQIVAVVADEWRT